jgi:hypothetical protein
VLHDLDLENTGKLGNYSLYCNKSELSALTKIAMKNASAREEFRSRYYRMYSRRIGTVSDNLYFEMNVKVQAKDFSQIDKIARDWEISL